MAETLHSTRAPTYRSYPHTLPAPALRFCEVPGDDIDELQLYPIAPKLRQVLIKATGQQIPGKKEQRISSVPTSNAAVKTAKSHAISAPIKRYAEGQKEAVTTRNKEYGTAVTVSKRSTRRAQQSGTTRGRAPNSGGKIDAGDGPGSDESDANGNRKRPLPKDAEDGPRKRRRGRNESKDESGEDATGQADEPRPDENAEQPVDEVDQLQSAIPGQREVLQPTAMKAGSGGGGGGGGGGVPEGSSEESDPKGSSGPQDPGNAVPEGSRGPPKPSGPFGDESSLLSYEDRDDQPVEKTRKAQRTREDDLSAADLITLAGIQIGNHSIHLQKYIDDVLSVRAAMGPNFTTKALNVIRQLIEINGNGHIWADAGDIENYVAFGIDEDEIWEDRFEDSEDEPELEDTAVMHRDGPRWENRWAQVATTLGCVEEVRGLYRRAKRLAEFPIYGDYCIKLSDVSDRSAEQYVADLKDTVESYETRLRQAELESYAKKLTSGYDSSGILAFRLGFKSKEEPAETVIPQLCFCDLTWDWIAEKVKDKLEFAKDDDNTSRVQTRLNDLLNAVASIRQACPLFKAPNWPTGTSMAKYCGKMTRAIDEHRDRSIDEARASWDHALKFSRATEDEERVTHLRDGRKELESRIEANGEPFSVDAWESGTLPAFSPPPKTSAAKVRAIGFDADRAKFPIKGEWLFDEPLGSGTYGAVSLWITEDASGNVTNRIAIKEVYLGPRPPSKPTDHWKVSKFWSGDIDDRYPSEAAIMQYLNSLPNSESILHCHTYCVYDVKKMYRLYLEYCEHSDLARLLKEYADADERVPVRVLWSVFEALASALCLMQHGRIPADDEILPEYTIVHLDIKPHNVFLTRRRDPDTWPELPQPVLGDFGLAQEHGETIPLGGGTRGYRAPEQMKYPEGHPRHGQDLIGPQTDVWAVGRVMLSLMDLASSSREIGDFTFDNPDEVPPFESEEYYHEQDERLVDLVLLCLRRDPEKRIESDDLWEQVHTEVTRLREPDALAMDTMPKPEDEVMPLYPVQEDFAL